MTPNYGLQGKQWKHRTNKYLGAVLPRESTFCAYMMKYKRATFDNNKLHLTNESFVDYFYSIDVALCEPV